MTERRELAAAPEAGCEHGLLAHRLLGCDPAAPEAGGLDALGQRVADRLYTTGIIEREDRDDVRAVVVELASPTDKTPEEPE